MAAGDGGGGGVPGGGRRRGDDSPLPVPVPGGDSRPQAHQVDGRAGVGGPQPQVGGPLMEERCFWGCGGSFKWFVFGLSFGRFN